MTQDITRFHNLHKGETCLLVGNGPNLSLTPPELFDLPSIGMNTIHLYEGWKPTYYTAVDSRVMREFGADIGAKYRDIPKFVPYPNLDAWQGDNFYRFYFRPGPLWPDNQRKLWPSGLLTSDGISYSNIMHVAMQIAYYMGFSTMLMIGVQHRENKARMHFWGEDQKTEANPAHVARQWLPGYNELVDGFAEQGVRALNISEDTAVPENILPRDDWRNYESQNERILSGS